VASAIGAVSNKNKKAVKHRVMDVSHHEQPGHTSALFTSLKSPMHAALRICTVLIALIAAHVAHAEPMPRDLAQRLSQIFAASKARGMVAAVVDGERTYIIGFGRARAGDRARPDARTLVRINSITKVMTGEILAAQIAERRLALSDPLRLYAPQGHAAPNYPGARPITLRDLAAHTAGLPRDNPYGLGRAERWAWLERVRLSRPPGRVAEYSNAAYMFLGDALETATQADLPTLFARHVTAPLALADTTLTPNADQCARVMTSSGREHPCAPTLGIGAMGGAYSTALDMERWMRAHLTAAPGTPRWTTQQPLVERAELERVIALDFAGEADAIAMGWLKMRLGKLPVLQKTGGGGDFMNCIVLAPTRAKAIFITVNRVDIEMLRKLTMRTNRLMQSFARGAILSPGER
jgi:D-alanyl-D-alanine-carboxypeptidase/D-alanyl-D-alanine-endopeptidase